MGFTFVVKSQFIDLLLQVKQLKWHNKPIDMNSAILNQVCIF